MRARPLRPSVRMARTSANRSPAAPTSAGPPAPAEPDADADPLAEVLRHVFEKYRTHDTGEPETPTSAPDTFAAAVATVDGRSYCVGETSHLFPLQSIAKPFVYGAALQAHGTKALAGRLGVEPTGGAFDSILGGDQIRARRSNPMINFGAITASSLLPGATARERKKKLLATLSAYAGRPLQIDRTALADRRRGDHRNRGLAHLMLDEGLIEGSAEEVVDTYFQQCSVRAHAGDLAWMAATLANRGRHPRTGVRVLAPRYVNDVLSVMFFCGLYEFSGQWAYRVGLPAKSSLSGALLAVVPGRMGVAVFSPRLDEHRKSARGVLLLEELSQQLALHVFSSDAIPRVPQARARRPRARATPTRLTAVRSKTSSFSSLLDDLIEKYRGLGKGETYTADPRLTRPDPNAFGICIATVDGETCGSGDFELPFLIQSISKIVAYGMALEDRGRETVLRTIDVEPSGAAYDSVIEVREHSKRAHNPMVNAGGIATTSLIWGEGPAHRLERIRQATSRYVGRDVSIDAPAFLAERQKNDRNRAIAYLLRHFEMLDGEIDAAIDLYLQQCSAVVSCRDLALAGATLANQGVHPLTGERAIERRYVRDLLSVLYTCGMYDYAGAWGRGVGIPAKSGVSGAIVAVVPGRMGIAVYSPPLDQHGNSVRGIRVFSDLAGRLGIHALQTHRSTNESIRRVRRRSR